jgi:hypothetical protein
MFEKAQAEYSDLVSKKETVQRDKAKIEAVIAECGVKKIEALQATWAKVRKREARRKREAKSGGRVGMGGHALPEGSASIVPCSQLPFLLSALTALPPIAHPWHPFSISNLPIPCQSPTRRPSPAPLLTPFPPRPR